MKKNGKKKSKAKYQKRYAKAGQPTKYTPEMISKVDEYLSTCGREQTELPTLEGFGIYLDVSTDSLTNWSKQYKEFFGSLKKILQYQKKQLINDGIYGGKEVNSTIVKLILQNNHDMREKVDNTTDDKPISFQIVSYQKTAHE